MRIWNLRLNLDEFNAVAGAAFTLEDKGNLLSGFILGCNAGTMPEQCSNMVQAGFKLGLKCREEAEGHSLRMSKGGKASAESRKKSLGTAQPSNNARTTLEQRPNQSPIPNPILKDKEINTVPRKRATKPKEEISLDALLDGKGSPLWEAYWKLAGVFGPAKNPSPKTTARLYHLALNGGFTVEHLHQKAQELAKASSEQKYLPQLAKWLEGEGYRNPTHFPQTNGGNNGSRSPKHRQAVDAEYAERISTKPRELPDAIGDDPDMLSLFDAKTN